MTRKSGFTVVELVTTLTIMAVMAAYALPKFKRALEESRVDMAAASLGSIATAEKIYWAGQHTYAPSLEALQAAGFLDDAFLANIRTAGAPFSYAITSADGGGFTATATRINSTLWSGSLTITQLNVPAGSITNNSDGSSVSPARVN